MLPLSHSALMELPSASLVSTGALADAFTEFMATSSRLESSYRMLQREVLRLNGELADRNAKLSATLAENLRMEQERDAARGAIALAQVSTMLAHEMRNPLASMELFADLIETIATAALNGSPTCAPAYERSPAR